MNLSKMQSIGQKGNPFSVTSQDLPGPAASSDHSDDVSSLDDIDEDFFGKYLRQGDMQEQGHSGLSKEELEYIDEIVS